ncbi:hypothetical protein J3B00_003237 [Pseudomonas sp. BP8]|nr:hypothetical protein [Pseudomonas sp. BP8]
MASRRQAPERFELVIGDCLKCVLSLDTKTLHLSLRLPIRFRLIVSLHGLYGLLIERVIREGWLLIFSLHILNLILLLRCERKVRCCL